jgi:hypothetical protein
MRRAVHAFEVVDIVDQDIEWLKHHGWCRGASACSENRKIAFIA